MPDTQAFREKYRTGSPFVLCYLTYLSVVAFNGVSGVYQLTYYLISHTSKDRFALFDGLRFKGTVTVTRSFFYYFLLKKLANGGRNFVSLQKDNKQ